MNANLVPWVPDKLMPGYESATLEFPPDYDGPVVATLVRKAGAAAQKRTVLYVHGFVDYFFQAHMAERFEAEGWSFYAIDLRKHGRSLLPGQHPCFCKRLSEYFADVTRAIDIVSATVDGPLLLAGHSTGGLVAALYAHEGERKERLSAVWLNSPFFDFRVKAMDRYKLGLAAATGMVFPFMKDPKPIEGFPICFGWIGAILAAHSKVHVGLSIACPVMVMHSDGGDIVLDWRSIAKWSPGLGRDVTVLQFPGGLHDLVLAKMERREDVFAKLSDWLRARFP